MALMVQIYYKLTKSRWAWIAAELTGMAMVYAILFTRLI